MRSNRTKLLKPLLIAAIFLINSAAFSQDRNYDDLVKFADFLKENHEFERAAAELIRYQYFAGKNDSLLALIGHYFLLANQFEKSAEAFRRLTANSTSRFCANAVVHSALIEFKKQNHPASLALLNRLDSCNHASEHESENGALLKSANLIALKEFNQARLFLTGNQFAVHSSSRTQSFIDLVNSGEKLPHKNAVQAAVLSAVLPGAGKFYLGQKSDGLLTMLLIASTSYLSYNGFDSDRPSKGWWFAGLSAVFYVGNVYGSFIGAQVHNERIWRQYQVGVTFAVDDLFSLPH